MREVAKRHALTGKMKHVEDASNKLGMADEKAAEDDKQFVQLVVGHNAAWEDILDEAIWRDERPRGLRWDIQGVIVVSLLSG